MWTTISPIRVLNKTFLPPTKYHSSSILNFIRRKTSKVVPWGHRFISSSNLNASNSRKEDIVIVGGGIAGLATALALHRHGIRSLVLEQSASLRTEGVSLSLSKNGWSALDVLGVGNQLRTQYLEIQGLKMITDEGKELRSFKLKDVNPSQELRAVERRVLVQTPADNLPADTLQFSSKLSHIQKDDETGETILQLVNGDQFSAKIVIGCDGIWSPIARWMGFSEPKYAGYCTIRGLAVYPDGHPYQPTVNYLYGRALRAGFVPMSHTKVYWFISYNTTSPGSKLTVMKKQALDLVKIMPNDLPKIIDHTTEDNISLSPIQDRWLWPVFSPPVTKGGVVLAGDAWHPMTPNLGQGACCALEDAVVLADKLGAAMKSGHASIEDAMTSYGDERWKCVFPLTIRAYLIGAVMQSINPVVLSLRSHLFRLLYRI